MTEEWITAIVAALRDDQQEQYQRLVATSLNSDEPEHLWKALGALHGAEFDLFERLSGWSIDDIGGAVRRVMPAVAFVPSLTLTDAVRFLGFAERVEPTFQHLASEQLRPHIASEPSLGKQLGESLRLGKGSGQVAQHVWAESFSNAAPEQAARFALELAESGNEARLLAALLRFLPTHDLAISLLQPNEAKLTAALVEEASAVGRDVWFALTAIAGFSHTAMNALQHAVSVGEVQALCAVANWLHRIAAPTVGVTHVPLQQLLNPMLEHAIANDEVRRWVDSGVASLLHRRSLRAVALPCLSRLGKVDADVAGLFRQTIDQVCEVPQDFTKLLTEWLLAEGVAFSAIRSLLSKCSAQQAPADLDAVVFAGALPARKVAAAQRLLALTHNGPVLCLFIASLAETSAIQPHGLELAAHMLNEAFAEYPDATAQFLEQRTRAGARHHPFAHVYRGVYANALRWRRVLGQLPELNELQPTESQFQVLRSVRQRMNRDIMRGAAERSVFAAIFTNVHIAQGRRFASHTPHAAPQVVDMQRVEHSIELPSSELADPVGGMLRRAKALATAR